MISHRAAKKTCIRRVFMILPNILHGTFLRKAVNGFRVINNYRFQAQNRQETKNIESEQNFWFL